MLFNRRLHTGIRDGTVTLTIRRWARPQARVGGTYRLDAEGVIEVTAIHRVAPAQVSDGDARKCGYANRASLLSELERWGGQLSAREQLYRIEFRYLASTDPRLELRASDDLSADELRALQAKLAAMDARSTHGPWTLRTMQLIEKRPRVLAAELAAACNRERLPFKTDVRKLKALGLTISHQVGYEISPRGRALLLALSAGYQAAE
jgi:hypothetical protein